MATPHAPLHRRCSTFSISQLKSRTFKHTALTLPAIPAHSTSVPIPISLALQLEYQVSLFFTVGIQIATWACHRTCSICSQYMPWYAFLRAFDLNSVRYTISSNSDAHPLFSWRDHRSLLLPTPHRLFLHDHRHCFHSITFNNATPCYICPIYSRISIVHVHPHLRLTFDLGKEEKQKSSFGHGCRQRTHHKSHPSPCDAPFVDHSHCVY